MKSCLSKRSDLENIKTHSTLLHWDKRKNFHRWFPRQDEPSLFQLPFQPPSHDASMASQDHSRVTVRSVFKSLPRKAFIVRSSAASSAWSLNDASDTGSKSESKSVIISLWFIPCSGTCLVNRLRLVVEILTWWAVWCFGPGRRQNQLFCVTTLLILSYACSFWSPVLQVEQGCLMTLEQSCISKLSNLITPLLVLLWGHL